LVFLPKPFEFACGSRVFRRASWSNYKNFARRKSAGNAKTAMASSCSQFIADFLQLGQRILHSGNILPQ